MIPVLATSGAASLTSVATTANVTGGPVIERPDLHKAAEAFEAVFLTEMLSHAGMGATEGAFGGDDFGGGAGEDAFASLLTREWATRLASEGGVGLTDAIYQALIAREAAHG